MDQLQAMRTFECVARLGSFAEAARSMNLAPSVVTRWVADLEQRLGARLLTRSTRRVSLSLIGERYLERVRDILREVDEAAAELRDDQRQVRGRVRLIAPAVFAARQLMPRLQRFHAMHPEVAVDVRTSHTVDTVDESHDISVVVRTPGLDGDFVAHRLATSQLVICASPEYLRRCGHPRHPLDMADHAVLLTAADTVSRSFVLSRPAGAGQALDAAKIEVRPRRILLSSPDAELGRAGALAGMGLVALPSYAVHDDLERGRLERLVGAWHLSQLEIHACLPSRKQVPAVVRALLEFLRSEFPSCDSDPWLSTGSAEPGRLRLAA